MYIVVKRTNGQLQSANCPVQHPTLAKAEAEAARLAEKHSGQEFAVLSLVSTHKVNNVPTSSLSKQDAGWYACTGCGDPGMEAYKPPVKFAVVGVSIDHDGYAPVTFFDANLRLQCKPEQRNLRWIPIQMNATVDA